MYLFQNLFCLGKYLMVPETHYSIPGCLKPGISLSIIMSLIRMLPAIGFNNQSRLDRGKIDNIRPNHDLTAEFVACHATPTQIPPQQTLGIGCLLTHAACSRGEH